MVDSKKKWMSILDSLAAAGTQSPAPSVSNSRPLRAARDAVDGHRVWDIDPADVIDDRISDRLDPRDVADLRDSIEATGQTVPILLRRHPAEADKYLLVYGWRRLEAIRSSQSVPKVRALIAQMDDASAVEPQVSENMARRDLSYIEKALFAHELVESGFGNQSRVAEVLTVSRSAISMAINTVSTIGVDLIRAIGPADNRQRTPYLFTGKELDEDTQLYYFGARYYDPRTSVWQSPDPILAKYLGRTGAGAGVYTPRNLNLLAYPITRPLD